LLVTGRSALGCSCAPGDPRSSLAQADGAFVGRLESRESPTPSPGGTFSSGQPVTYTFVVERSVKGDLGKRVNVESAAYGASCGLEVRVGERTGLFLYRDDGQWKSGLCSQIEPEALIEAAKPLPAPTSRGPVSFVVGGRYGPVTALGVDRKAKTVSYGHGADWDATTHLSVCPGSLAMAEWGYRTGGTNVPVLAVRKFDDFEDAEAHRLPELRDSEPDFNRLIALSCSDERGTEVLVAVSDGQGEHDAVSRGRIIQIRNGSLKTVYSGTLQMAAFSRSVDKAYITGGRGGEDVMVVDLSTGRARRIARIARGSGGLSLSPSELRLATTMILDPQRPRSFRVTVVDMTSTPAAVRNIVLDENDAYGETKWANDTTVLFVPRSDRSGRVQVFDHMLRRKGSFTGWYSSDSVVVDNTLYGIGWGGKLFTASLPNGPTKTLRTFDTPMIYTLAFVPPQAKIQKGGPPTASPTKPPPSPSATAPTPRAIGPVESSGSTRALTLTGAGLLLIAAGGSWILYRRRRRAALGAP
ncbi:MAG: hypothetical protein ACRDJ1_00520, partial [Actinomycetota bacterium]